MSCSLRSGRHQDIDYSMKPNIGLLVFTDLDGTLIDHDTYDWAPAKPALAALKTRSAGVVLASSKTAAEMSGLRTALGLSKWPAIVENGAGVLPPYVNEIAKANQYRDVLDILATVPNGLRAQFRGFGAATAAEVAAMTGLTPKAAALAKQRAFSEPGQWLGSDAQKSEFLEYLGTRGIATQQGGRFLTLSFGGNKVDQMRAIIGTHHPDHTIALGDAPNDVQMLEQADYGVVVANPHRPALPPLKGEAEGRILRTKAAGPEGWNTAILDLLDRLDLH